MAHQRLEHRELAGRQRDLLALARQAAQAEVELKSPKVTVIGSLDGAPVPRPAAGGAARTWMRASSSRGLNGLGQVVVGADLEADDAVDVLDLGPSA